MVNNHYRWDFIGLSTDEKPTPETSEKVANGSTFYCSDTSKLYVWYKNQWYEKVVEGGGSSYTAGNGIDIDNNEISVDTDTIQPKLTAGTGIDITDNTISATGGGGPTVVQTTGTSTTDVMSQDATTKLVYPDIDNNPYKMVIGEGLIYDTNKGVAINGTLNTGITGGSIAIGTPNGGGALIGQNGRADQSVAIGNSATVGHGAGSVAIGAQAYVNSGTNTGYNVALGYNAYAGNAAVNNTVALGANAKTTRTGEVNIGTGGQNAGYNSTDYRVLGGVHDGQDAHDAVNVEQVNATIDAINTALSISIPHIGA